MYNGIDGKISSLRDKTRTHGHEIYFEDSNLHAVKFGTAHYIRISEGGDHTYFGDHRSINRIYKYRFNGEFFVCIDDEINKFADHKQEDLHDDMVRHKRYHIIHPESLSVFPTDIKPNQIGGDTLGNIVLAYKSKKHIGTEKNIITIFDTSNSSFIREREQLKPASEDEMQEFEESDKIKDFIDMNSDNQPISENDVFDSVPVKDLREAHNDRTFEQHMEKVFTNSPLDKNDLMTLIPGIGDSFDSSRPELDLREEHLEFMESNEYRKILEHSKKVMESDGQRPEDVKKLQQISEDLNTIKSASSLESSELDIREVQTINQLVEEIKEARQSIEETEQEKTRKSNDDQNKSNKFL